MNNKKGQAAMEFLMTYGWAILAAIVVIAVLAIYFRPSQLVTSNSVVTAPFFANAQQVTSTGVVLEIKNNGGELYNVSGFNVTIKSPSGVICLQNITSGTIGAGAQKTLNVACVIGSLNFTSGATISGDIEILYTKSGSNIALKSSGSIADKVA